MSFEHWIQAIQRLDYACVRRNVTGQYASYELVEPAWGLKKLELMDEVEAMQNEVAVLEKEKAAFEESQRKFSEFYILEAE
jgi:radical SAM superfamily enzyme